LGEEYSVVEIMPYPWLKPGAIAWLKPGAIDNTPLKNIF